MIKNKYNTDTLPIPAKKMFFKRVFIMAYGSHAYHYIMDKLKLCFINNFLKKRRN